MGKSTDISWTDHTFNPWWGCFKVSTECTNCYAAEIDKSHGGWHWGQGAPRRFFGDKHWREPVTWNAAAARDGVRRRVFSASMADVFEDRSDLTPHRARLWELIKNTPNLDWLLLTKRPENFGAMLPWLGPLSPVISLPPWPNVWLGVTCGVRASLPRVELLRRTPAAVRFISCEPILEEITADDWDRVLPGIDWLIVGDESGPRARPADLDWVRIACDAAARHNVRFHLKQWDRGRTHLPMLDGRQWVEFPESESCGRPTPHHRNVNESPENGDTLSDQLRVT